MSTQRFVLSFFATVAISSIISLWLFHIYLLPSHIERSQNLVKIMSTDMATSRYVGAISVIDKCRESGTAYIPGIDGDAGLTIDCKNIEVRPIYPIK